MKKTINTPQPKALKTSGNGTVVFGTILRKHPSAMSWIASLTATGDADCHSINMP